MVFGFEKTTGDGEMIRNHMGGGGGKTVAATINGIGRGGRWVRFRAPAYFCSQGTSQGIAQMFDIPSI